MRKSSEACTFQSVDAKAPIPFPTSQVVFLDSVNAYESSEENRHLGGDGFNSV